MKVLELTISTAQHARVLNDQQSSIQKPINFNWTKKLITTTGKYRKFDAVKLVSPNRNDIYYILDSITISNGNKAMETSTRKIYYNINLGVEVGEPEED
jgi:hypothetical protein